MELISSHGGRAAGQVVAPGSHGCKATGWQPRIEEDTA